MSAYRRFNLDYRSRLQVSLNEGKSLSGIARDLGMSITSVSREIKLHRSILDSHGYGGNINRCIHRFECTTTLICPGHSVICKKKTCAHCRTQNCNLVCKDFEEEHCTKLDKPPYVCNGCTSRHRCSLKKLIYDAKTADSDATKLRSESRSGFNLTEEELAQIDQALSDRLKMGQSIHHIFATSQDEFTICEKTAYALVKAGCTTAKPIDLPRMVRMKPRRHKSKEVKVDKKCRIGRTYEDYLTFMATHPDSNVLEGDTVEGVKGGKCILTLTWTQFDLQIAFLRDRNNSASVTDIVNLLYENLGFELWDRVIPKVWLLDNGTEFSDPMEIEKFGVRVFYCDPSAPYQKGCCENTHEHYRRIVPKGTSMNEFTQKDIDLAYSHIDSLCRAKLNDHSPYEAFEFTYGKGILKKHFHIRKIDPKRVHLKPSLLKKKGGQ